MKLIRTNSQFIFTSSLIASLFATSSAITFPLTVNSDAEVTFTGSSTQKESVFANTAKSITIDWLTAATEVQISVHSLNPKFNDTTFTSTIEANGSDYPAWDPTATYATTTTVSYNGKNWSNGWWVGPGVAPGTDGVWKELSGGNSYTLSLTLSAKPLPTDSAYIPVRTNVAAKLRATPLSMISGTVPANAFEFNLAAKTIDTIALPVVTGPTSIMDKRVSTNDISVQQSGNQTHLTLPALYRNGEISVISLNGRQIGSMQLSSDFQNDLSIWDVATGIYFIRVSTSEGVTTTQKLSHSGGDLRIIASCGINSQVTQNSSPLSRSAAIRASTAQYKFEIIPTDANYTTISENVSLSAQMNSEKQYSLVNPNQTQIDLSEYIDEATYNNLFKHRYGIDANYAGQQPGGDFFTYASFQSAINELANKSAVIFRKEGLTWGEKVVVTNKSDGSTHTYITTADYNSHSGAESSVEADYGEFLQIGDVATKKFELAAFLANISHETTGGWPSAPDGAYAWGLHYKEEAGMNDNTVGQYVSAHALFPPTDGQSYHGRGPKQISYNYNYGQFSEFLYFDKTKLLNDPKIVSHDPVVSFMSALWFWMTPQGKKPSCHQVMTGLWTPSATDISLGRDKSKFGMTVNIINGGLECGGSDGDSRVADRIGYYKRYCEFLNITPEDYCDCGQIKPY